MRPEIRRAAIRAAAKTALIAGLAGCSGDPKASTTSTPSNVATGDTAKPAAPVDCEAHLTGLKKMKKEELPDGDPVKERMDVYGEVFANRAEREAPETQKCCTEDLVKNGSRGSHRWECCSALADLPKDASPSACTPWGPPCPPAMPAVS